MLFLAGKLPAAVQHALDFDTEHARARTLLLQLRNVKRLKDMENMHFMVQRFGEAVEAYVEALGTVGTRSEEGDTAGKPRDVDAQGACVGAGAGLY